MSKTPTAPTVRTLRERANLTPADIERQTGGIVKRPALGAIERGRVPNPTVHRAMALAKVLGIDIDTLYAAISASVAEEQKRRKRRHPVNPGPRDVREPPTLAEAILASRQITAILERMAKAS